MPCYSFANLAEDAISQLSTGPQLDAGYTTGPALPAELPKPPFTPGAAARIAFFFGPLAGAIVSAISLRRMRHPDKAQKVTALALSMALIYSLVLFFIPELLSRIVGLAAEAAFYVTFQRMQEREFVEWQAANASPMGNFGS